MSFRSLVSIGTLVALTSIIPTPIDAQAKQGRTEAKKRAQAKHWTPPLTPDGQPDLQGNWVNRSATPFEQPKKLEGRQFLTDAEVAELKKRADRLFKDGHSDFLPGDALFLAALENIEQYKNPQTTGGADQMPELDFDNRTSLIVDPPDGKLPPYTPAGQRRLSCVTSSDNHAKSPGGSGGPNQFSALHHMERTHASSGSIHQLLPNCAESWLRGHGSHPRCPDHSTGWASASSTEHADVEWGLARPL